MKTILLTGFEPFLNLAVNPTEQIANALHGRTYGQYRIEGHVLPVDFNESDAVLKQLLDKHKPHIVLSLGVAAGRHHFTPERIAINVKDGEADNNGYAPEDEAIALDGEDGMFTNLPVRELVNVLRDNGYPASISNSAGTYLCNNIMYVGAQYAKETGAVAGFLHMPANFELALAHRRLPSWHQRDLQACVELCIEQLTQ
ncbi:pyroglutamyl-peptidase I [Caryophanon latum]|uniref:Pyrrolidone-carboxylate peptidase n=1 Tax=Caryophanon latum TaxID=33977 RepID=A0A1C0YPZ9_9BACL|nr:pyroglutamyl-peptidase I [Caryophanon latum]OCS89231.1 peptidase C15 [Caryophanon latum]